MVGVSGLALAVEAAEALHVLSDCDSSGLTFVERSFGRSAMWNHELEPRRRYTMTPQMVCAHRQTQGSVSTARTKVKQGISGAKATGVVLTAWFSILATGLSRKQKFTQARCSNCGAQWLV